MQRTFSNFEILICKIIKIFFKCKLNMKKKIMPTFYMSTSSFCSKEPSNSSNSSKSKLLSTSSNKWEGAL